jgi:hypothetical protein
MEDGMADFLSGYSIQYWLESCPQGYLEGTEYGHAPGAKEPELVLSDPLLREQAIKVTTQMVVGERCALSASSGLINAAPDEAARRFLATQTLDEARHVEIFTQRLFDLGVKKQDLESTIREHANPNLVRFAELLLEKVDAKDFIPGVVGQNIILEGMAFSVFEMMHAANRQLNPKFAQTLSGTIADERRHVGFGENYIGALVKQHPEKKAQVERMQKEMSYYMLATFADQFRGDENRRELDEMRRKARAAAGGAAEDTWQGAHLSDLGPEQMEGLLANTVLGEFKTRLGRIGIEYQTPLRP